MKEKEIYVVQNKLSFGIMDLVNKKMQDVKPDNDDQELNEVLMEIASDEGLWDQTYNELVSKNKNGNGLVTYNSFK